MNILKHGLSLLAIGFALSQPPSARAELAWIWSDSADAKAISFRHSFNVPDKIRNATLWVGCDNHARVSINGKEVLANDDWSSPSRANVTEHLKPGTNEITIEARNDDGAAGLLARLRIRPAEGNEITIESDASWETRPAGASAWKTAKAVGKYGDDPWGDTLGLGVGRPIVIQPEEIETLPGFKVELLYAVPKADEGSWVSMTVDPQGRILACDQYGGLFRMTPSAIGSTEPSKIERLESPVGSAHGLLYAFDSLYVMVNEQRERQGLWRLRDLNGDDQFEDAQHLQAIQGGGEHGTHAVVLGPDKNSLYVVCGNHTKLPEGIQLSRSPMHWQEDQLLPRMWDANGHARGILAPGGYICRLNPDGSNFEVVSSGYRNAYDFAFNDLGDIITYDSDMEWDAGLPWYRPTRICLATSGSELGWRSGSGKWPTYYPDSLPALVDIGPGSPTGLESGQGSRFPAKYQRAVFANDWTYGTMYAIHMTPKGGAYEAVREEFVSGKPLPLTDLTVNPKDGALYFAIGGRRTQSAVYRVTYTGPENTAAAAPGKPTPEIQLRWQLEALHQQNTGPEAIATAWPYLAHQDRWIRFAARVAIERQPVESWATQALSEKRPWAIIETAIALAHANAKQYRDAVLNQLHTIPWDTLPLDGQLALTRAYGLTLIRLGQPVGDTLSKTIARLDAHFPATNPDLNRELAGLLITLGSPTATPKTLQLLATARDTDLNYASDALLARNDGYADAFNKAAASRPNQQQIAYAYALRVAENGWSPALRRAYYNWFPSTAPWQGGNSFRGFIDNIRKEALAKVANEEERAALDALSLKQPAVAIQEFTPPKGPGQDYDLADILDLVGPGLQNRNFEQGRNLFHSTGCYTCHRFNGSGGGLGPDLTTSSSRFSVKDLVENIVEPSNVISDQYGSEQVELADGSTLIGRAWEENGQLHIVYDPRNPEEGEVVDLSSVKARQPYPVSFMPTGLLNLLNPEEVLDLLAYIQSSGNPENPAFKPAK